jgi:hypothetical protein
MRFQKIGRNGYTPQDFCSIRRTVFMNQKLYVVAEAGMASETVTDAPKASIFSGTSYLLSIDTVSGEVECLGEVPADLQRTEKSGYL